MVIQRKTSCVSILSVCSCFSKIIIYQYDFQRHLNVHDQESRLTSISQIHLSNDLLHQNVQIVHGMLISNQENLLLKAGIQHSAMSIIMSSILTYLGSNKQGYHCQ